MSAAGAGRATRDITHWPRPTGSCSPNRNCWTQIIKNELEGRDIPTRGTDGDVGDEMSILKFTRPYRCRGGRGGRGSAEQPQEP